jgi:hypothetical protein
MWKETVLLFLDDCDVNHLSGKDYLTSAEFDGFILAEGAKHLL